MSQQTSVVSAVNFYQSPLTITFTDVPKNPETYAVPAYTSNGAGTANIGQSVPWWYYNNSNFANHNIQVTYAGNSPAVIYIWQHGSDVYWSNTVPGEYTNKNKLWTDVGQPFVLSISDDFAPSATKPS